MSISLAELRSELEDIQLACEGLSARLEVILDRLDRAEFELVGEPSSTPLPAPTGAARYTQADREEAARETGAFFRRCLAGEPRGDSGRSRIRIQNRVYVVIREVNGTVHTDPVLVFDRCEPVKRIVALGSSNNFGDSVFAGFASRWEAKLAVESAGYTWP
eukprot:Skav203989  [mRNA]  locus=scaffold3297:26868:27350:+ [translate_table: standard]